MPNDQIAAAVKVLSRTVIYPHEAEALDIIRETIKQHAVDGAPNPTTPIVRNIYSQAALQLGAEGTRMLLQLLIHSSDAATLQTVFDAYQNLDDRHNELIDTVEQILREHRNRQHAE
jgi:hypothetical protein